MEHVTLLVATRIKTKESFRKQIQLKSVSVQIKTQLKDTVILILWLPKQTT